MNRRVLSASTFLRLFAFGLFNLFVCNANEALYDIDMKKLEPISIQPVHIDWGTLRLMKKSRNTYIVQGDISIQKAIGNNAKVGYEIYQIDEKTGSMQKRIAKSYFACDFMKQDTVVYPKVVAASNLPKPGVCPVPKGNYTIHNFIFDQTGLPPVVPLGQYKARFFGTIADKLIFELHVHARTTKRAA